MSSSEATTSTISLSSRDPGVELRVYDSALKLLGQARQRLVQQVPPGLYQVEYRAGTTVEQKLVSLRDGKPFTKEDWLVPFATPVPVEGTSTSREAYRGAVDELFAAAKSASPGPSLPRSGFLFLLRNMDNAAGTDAPTTADRIAGYSLLDQNLQPIADLAKEAVVNTADHWLGWCKLLPPGNYVLQRQGTGDGLLRQPVTLSQDWITAVFVPNLATEAAPQLSSIQMFRPDRNWLAMDEPWEQLMRVSEQALAGLRRGYPELKPDEIRSLLQGKFDNPMLGLLGAHCMLLAPPVDEAVFAEVLGNLDNLIPGHPDLIALHLAARRLNIPLPAAPAPEQAQWPPMLAASYRELLASDRQAGGAIVPNSQAEAAAPALVASGPWTTWRYKPVAHDTFTLQSSGGGSGTGLESFITKSQDLLTKIGGMGAVTEMIDHSHVMSWLRPKLPSGTSPHAPDTTDHTALFRAKVTEKILGYLHDCMKYEGITSVAEMLAHLDVQDLCEALGLPFAVVKDARDRLRAALPSPAGPVSSPSPSTPSSSSPSAP